MGGKPRLLTGSGDSKKQLRGRSLRDNLRPMERTAWKEVTREHIGLCRGRSAEDPPVQKNLSSSSCVQLLVQVGLGSLPTRGQ